MHFGYQDVTPRVEPRRNIPLERVITDWRTYTLRSRAILAEFGAHGDARIALSIGSGWKVNTPGAVHEVNDWIVLEEWSRLDALAEDDERLFARVEDELRRALGLPPGLAPSTT